MRSAFRCRAYPTPEQALLLSRTFGCIRVVWNRTLATRHARYHGEGNQTSYTEANRALTQLKKLPDLLFLNEVSAVALQQTLRHQQDALTAFFAKRAKYPRFKTHNGRQSAQFTRSAFRIKEGVLFLAKTQHPFVFVWSWPKVDITTLDPSMVTVSREEDGRWFVSFSVEVEPPPTLPSTGQATGVDMGLTDFAVLSVGDKIPHPRNWERHERRLKRYQRIVARRQPGSKNRAKARQKVARCHSRIRDGRCDFLHKTSTGLIRRFDLIAIEDLAVSNMVRRGSRKQGLNGAISRTGWAKHRAMLDYKALIAGRRIVVVDRWFPSSKTCSICGHLLTALAGRTRHWTCPDCGTRHDRDVNAAKNILAAGLAVTACGDDVSRQGTSLPQSSLKQEYPAGNRRTFSL